MDQVHIRILQQMTPEQKLKAAERLYWSARELKTAAVRAQHPDWPEAEVEKHVRDCFLYARSH